jgi:integrase
MKDGLYPVKLRVYSSVFAKKKLYSTGLNYSEMDFQRMWNEKKAPKEFVSDREYLEQFVSKAKEVIRSIELFSFENFEKKMFRKSGDSQNVFYHFNELIVSFKKKERIGTSDMYKLSLNSIKAYLKNKKGKDQDKLLFIEITKDWLEDYEKYMLKEMKRSITTVSMYLRTLRAVFNHAIEQKDISKEYYPFTKSAYQIPNIEGEKKALSRNQLKILYEAVPKTPEQEKAKDFWFFSYACNGMNIADIALIKFTDIQDNNLSFIREKTKNTSKERQKKVKVYLTDFALNIIEKYEIKEEKKSDYLFGIIKEEDSPEQKRVLVKNFTRFINQHIKKIALANDLPSDISTYWARHSFATNAIRSGASMEFVGEALSHSNVKTTQNYFAGFADEQKREIAENLMKF